MPEVSTILTIFDKILNIVGLIRDKRIKRDEKIDESLKLLYKSLIETRSYTDSLKKGKEKDRSKEFEIAELWHQASIPLRHVDAELAQLCFLKGGYWLDPESWSQVQIEENNIALENVIQHTKSLLVN